jgi:hypothetical protein
MRVYLYRTCNVRVACSSVEQHVQQRVGSFPCSVTTSRSGPTESGDLMGVFAGPLACVSSLRVRYCQANGIPYECKSFAGATWDTLRTLHAVGHDELARRDTERRQQHKSKSL